MINSPDLYHFADVSQMPLMAEVAANFGKQVIYFRTGSDHSPLSRLLESEFGPIFGEPSKFALAVSSCSAAVFFFR